MAARFRASNPILGDFPSNPHENRFAAANRANPLDNPRSKYFHTAIAFNYSFQYLDLTMENAFVISAHVESITAHLQSLQTNTLKTCAQLPRMRIDRLSQKRLRKQINS